MMNRKYIWRVKILASGIGQDSFTVEAKDDVEARKKAVSLLASDYADEKYQILYAETTLICKFRE